METRDLRSLDWPEVARIYAEGIATGFASFETEPPAWEDWDASHSRIRVVAELDGRIAGWCALSPVSSRHCYRGVAEESVYVAGWAQGRGVGRALLDEVVARAERAGIWTLQAGIFPENKPSLRLHLGCGFRLVGVRERLGEACPPAAGGDFGPTAAGPAGGGSGRIWRDVLLLERRSEVIGR
jgi:phosphinothricin acetyltransferase